MIQSQQIGQGSHKIIANQPLLKRTESRVQSCGEHTVHNLLGEGAIDTYEPRDDKKGILPSAVLVIIVVVQSNAHAVGG